ncbi:hypothetical protein EYF80_001722 [Liparis tanakae]|uniref:Uncharacterized protein n=1 Tax=Liparis tanakae TaxID=230148 RepID=A0A4Z2JDP9_9TELE|nr:hypothetical protein EYF80_001722 [Liparis tanakae]
MSDRQLLADCSSIQEHIYVFVVHAGPTRGQVDGLCPRQVDLFRDDGVRAPPRDPHGPLSPSDWHKSVALNDKLKANSNPISSVPVHEKMTARRQKRSTDSSFHHWECCSFAKSQCSPNLPQLLLPHTEPL